MNPRLSPESEFDGFYNDPDEALDYALGEMADANDTEDDDEIF